VALELQSQIFRYFIDTLDFIQTDRKLSGDYSGGIVDVHGDDFEIVERSVIHVDEESGAKAELIEYTVDRGMSYEAAFQLYTETRAAGAQASFCEGRRAPHGYKRDHTFRQVSLMIGRVTGMSRSGRSQLFKLMLPASGAQRGNRHRREIRERWKTVKDLKLVAEAWKKQYGDAAKKCGHPPGYFKKGVVSLWPLTLLFLRECQARIFRLLLLFFFWLLTHGC
jgi:hypothetical protein